MLQTIPVSELLPGMHVNKVTQQQGSLTVTAGGKVKSEQHIQEIVSKGVLEVEIDLSKSNHLDTEAVKSKEAFAEDINASLAVRDQARNIQDKLLKRATKGKLSNVDEVNEITADIIDTAFEKSEVFSAVTLVKEEDVEYFLEHSINCAILIVLFGQYLGLEKPLLDKLGAGTLLMDVGMLKLPLLLTQKQQSLTAAEQKKMQSHIDISLQSVASIDGLDDISLQIIAQHHERMDGSGYPKGLKGDAISQYSRMAAIVDTYDSLITTRPYREALAPADALLKLTEQSLGLDQDLVAKFVQCLGAYPVGSVVKLESQQLAMVTKVNRQQPLAPTVMAFYDVGNKSETLAEIDLSASTDKIVASCGLEEGGMGISSLLLQ